MRLYKIVSYAGAFFYLLIGLLIVASCWRGDSGLYINLFVGSLFIGLAFSLYRKFRTFLKVAKGVENCPRSEVALVSTFASYLFWEKLLAFGALAVALIIFLGAAFRVFTEKMSVFG